MYERAFRLSAERSASAAVLVAALTLLCGMHPAAAQNRPSVIVNESVLDQLGPPPRTLPDVLLQQQPQAYRPAQRVGSDAASIARAPTRLLPPPPSMPKSHVMLPGALQSLVPEAAPASAPAVRPQTARVPKAAPLPKVDKLEPPSSPPVSSATPAPTVIPPKITPPKVSVPDAPSVAPPPPPPTASAPKPTEPAEPAATEAASDSKAPPSEPPVAMAEPPAAAPAPSLPKLVPPAPADAAKPSLPQPKASAESKAAAVPQVPAPAAVEPPPPPPPVSEAPPAPKPSKAVKSPAQSAAAQPAPQGAEPPPDGASAGESDSPAAKQQLAALPPASPEILDDGQLYRIPFGSASSEISQDGKKQLDALAQRLKKDDALRLQLLGYAGGTQDSASKARRTSLFRALSVRTYLMKQGIRSTRMDVRALGNLAEGGAPDRVDAVIRK